VLGALAVSVIMIAVTTTGALIALTQGLTPSGNALELALQLSHSVLIIAILVSGSFDSNHGSI